MADKDEDKYQKMLKQMGLSVDEVDDEFKKVMYKKLGLGKTSSAQKKEKVDDYEFEKVEEPPKKRAKRSAPKVDEAQQNIANMKESSLMATLGQSDNAKIGLKDLFKSLDDQKMSGSSANVVNTNALRK